MSFEWRTETIRALCNTMRATGDYGACPILADALQDADFKMGMLSEWPTEDFLTKLRSPLDKIEAERIVAIIYSEETKNAVRWMEEFASSCGQTSDNYNEAFEVQNAYLRRGGGWRQLQELIASGDVISAIYRPITYNDVVTAGYDSAADEDDESGGDYVFTQHGSERARDNMSDPTTRTTFWAMWQRITAKTIPEDRHANPFGCSC